MPLLQASSGFQWVLLQPLLEDHFDDLIASSRLGQFGKFGRLFWVRAKHHEDTATDLTLPFPTFGQGGEAFLGSFGIYFIEA